MESRPRPINLVPPPDRRQSETALAIARGTARMLRTLGFSCITPEGNQSPTVAFVVPDPESTRAKLARARVAVKVEWHQMRVSPSVYNNDAETAARVFACSTVQVRSRVR